MRTCDQCGSENVKVSIASVKPQPQTDLDYARRLAADRIKAFVMPLNEVYALRTAALGEERKP